MRSPELFLPDARAAVREAAASDPAAAATSAPMPWDRHLRAAALASVAMAVPDRVVTNATIAEGAGVTEQWIVHRTGVHERRHVSEGQRLQDLATAAGRGALEEAGVDAAELDLILVATVAPDELLPNCAPLVARDLGATKAGAMDVGAACTGFLSCLAARDRAGRGRARGQRPGHRRRRAQPLHRPARTAAPRPSSPTAPARSWSRPRRTGRVASATSSFAATARVPGRSRQPTESASSACRATTPSRTRSSGCPRPPARPSAARASPSTRSTSSSTTRPTPASSPPWASGSTSTRTRSSTRSTATATPVSATLPIALADARERGLLEPGMNVLLAAFGAGFTWGAGVIEWAA